MPVLVFLVLLLQPHGVDYLDQLIMDGILRGLRKHEVVLLLGDNKRDLVREFVQSRFKCTMFSMLDIDMKRVGTSLLSRRWDGGACPVIVFYRCEQWMRELAPLIQDRQSKQAVLLVSDGVYTPQTSLMKSLATVSIVSGQLAPTVFSGLKSSMMSRQTLDASEPVIDTAHPQRYKGAIACSDLDTVIDQIHHASIMSLEDACTNIASLADIDTLRYRVPDDIISHCLPVIPSITYKSQSKRCKKQLAQKKFAATIPPLLAKTTKTMMSLHDTLEYVRMAHRIEISPQIVQFPRDDNDALLVTNANDQIRTFVYRPAFRGTMAETLTTSVSDETVFGHPVEQARLRTLAMSYVVLGTSRKRQRTT
jgi:hypothetical protein